MHLFASFTHKGGSGKTTQAFTFAHWAALRGYRVLVIDLDQQANISQMLMGSEQVYIDFHRSGKPTVAQVFLAPGSLQEDPTAPLLPIGWYQPKRRVRGEYLWNKHEFIRVDDPVRTKIPDWLAAIKDKDKAIGSITLLGSRCRELITVTRHPKNEGTLSEYLHVIKDHFDIAIFDLPPQECILHYAVLRAGVNLIIPTDPSFSCLHAVPEVREMLDYVQTTFGHVDPRVPKTSVLGVIGNRRDPRNSHKEDHLTKIKSTTDSQRWVWLGTIRESESFAAVSAEGVRPIFSTPSAKTSVRVEVALLFDKVLRRVGL